MSKNELVVPLQKLMASIGFCQTGVSPPVILRYSSFKCDTSVVVLFVLCFGVEFLCCLNLMNVFLVVVKFRRVATIGK